MDLSAIRERVGYLRTNAARGAPHRLIGFDANAIQEYVTSNGRPIGMRGASEQIKLFDRACAARPGAVFAGGGRALMLVPADDAEGAVREICREFGRQTHGEILAAAVVEYDPANELGSLAWLRLALKAAKEAAPSAARDLPKRKASQCPDCTRRDVGMSTGRNSKDQVVCASCWAAVAAGAKVARGVGESAKTLDDLAFEGRVAVVAADGNDMGRFFSSVHSLEALAAASAAVQHIFAEAHIEARQAVERHLESAWGGRSGESARLIASVTGGDEVRCFLDPRGLIAYVETLVEATERLAAEADDLDGLLAPESAKRLGRLGVGIGAVVAHPHFHAARMAAQAADLERSAKLACRSPGGPRSALDAAALASGDELGPGVDRHRSTPNDGRPYSLESKTWQETKRRARALGRLAGTQLSRLARAPDVSEDEFLNAFLYQIARSSDWQRWFDECGHDWRKASDVRDHRPRAGLLLLADLLRGPR